MRQFLPFLISLALAYAAAIIGSLFTVDAIDTWYATLAKPLLSPPNWIFGPVWTTLYAFMGIAAWLVYERRSAYPSATSLLWIYAAHLAVNTLWSIAFFGLQNPLLALLIIGILWGLILFLTLRFYRIHRIAAYLFMPYLAWVTFASYLNLSIVLLN